MNSAKREREPSSLGELGTRYQCSGRPGQLGFTEQSTRKKGASQRKSSRGLQREFFMLLS